MPTLEERASLVKLLAPLLADLAQWEAAEAQRLASPSALVGQPFVVATDDGAMAIHMERDPGDANLVKLIPTHARPSAMGGPLGCTCFTRADAERVAAHYPGVYFVVPVREFAQRRIASLKSTIATLKQLISEAA